MEFESGQLPYGEHGKPESHSRYRRTLWDAAGTCVRRVLCMHHLPRYRQERIPMSHLTEMDDDEADRLEMLPG